MITLASSEPLSAVVGRKRIRELEVMVAATKAETHDTTTLVLFTGNDHLDYEAGHFLTIDPHQFPELERFTAYLEEVKGKRELARAYSMSSAPYERQLAITVKEEKFVAGRTAFPPLLSPLLVRGLPVGTRLTVTGFTGPYTLPSDIADRTDHVLHCCAGSGIVPNFSMIKQCLKVHSGIRHTLVFSNRTWNDIIFRDQLAQLTAEHPRNLTVVHALTRETSPESRGPNVQAGRISAELLREAVPDFDAVEVFLCGPAVSKHERAAATSRDEKPAPRFLETAVEALASLGIESQRIHRESYG